MRAGWYHWKADEVAGQMNGALQPYLASTPETPHPRVLLYTPALTLANSTLEEQTTMIFNLILVSGAVSHSTCTWHHP